MIAHEIPKFGGQIETYLASHIRKSTCHISTDQWIAFQSKNYLHYKNYIPDLEDHLSITLQRGYFGCWSLH